MSYNIINQLSDDSVTVETEKSDYCIDNGSDEDPTFMINNIDRTSTCSESLSYIVQVPVNSTVITENDTDFIINGVVDYLIKEVCKKNKSRKRSCDPSSWQSNIRKKRLASGMSYLSKKGNKIIQCKKLKPSCVNCKKKCSEKIDEHDRKKIFSTFWDGDKDINLKRQYIATCIEEKCVDRKRERNGSHAGVRQKSLVYSFEIENVNTGIKNKIDVCKTFYLNTLNISDMFVRTALKKKTHGGMVSLDRRGYHAPPNKISDDIRDGVKKHIESFPAIESHYSREKTVKKYLGNELNISKMYKLYVDNCKEHKVPTGNIAKHWLYSEIFNNEFNLAFKEPANDSCDICDEFIIKIKNSTIEEEACLQKMYEAHLDEAKLRYAEKKRTNLKQRVLAVRKKP